MKFFLFSTLSLLCLTAVSCTDPDQICGVYNIQSYGRGQSLANFATTTDGRYFEYPDDFVVYIEKAFLLGLKIYVCNTEPSTSIIMSIDQNDQNSQLPNTDRKVAKKILISF